MIIGQTVLSVRRGTEHRAEAALDEVRRHLMSADGARGHMILKSFGMSPLASALTDDNRQATLLDVHYLVQTQWDSLAAHDAFFASEGLRRAYAVLASILASGPYEVLYESLADREQSSVAI